MCDLYISSYLSGGSLEQLLKNERLKEGTILVFARQIVSGLVYLHHKHIVHRDIKGMSLGRIDDILSLLL